MRALHLLKTSVGATWALREAAQLTAYGVECHVVLPHDSGLAEAYRAAGVGVHIADLDSVPLSPRFFSASRDLQAIAALVRPDIVHSHFVSTTIVMRHALRRAAYPRVFQVAGPLHLELWPMARLEIASSDANDYWIASCRWTFNRYLKLGISASRLFLAHYGSKLDAFGPGSPGRLRGELNVAPSTRLVGMVSYCYRPRRYLGQRRGLKGHEDFIDAIRIVRDRGLDAVGVIVGGPWLGANRYFDQVRRYAERRVPNGVRFLGNRDDVADIYADLDVAVHPSLSENLGGAAESLLHSVPTVTTNVGGFPDLICDGVTGRMVSPRSPKGLADAIDSFLRDPNAAAVVARAGRERARAILDVRKTAAAVLTAYNVACHHSSVA